MGFSALQTGIAYWGMAITSVIGGLVGGQMAARLGTRPVVLGGTLSQFTGAIVMAAALVAGIAFVLPNVRDGGGAAAKA